MALVLADRVKETTTTTGTGTVTLLGASTGFQSFAAVGNANTTYYTIAAQTGTEWEVGIGTYTSSGTTLARTTVLSSSNSGSPVNFSAGTKDVFVTYPSSRSIYADGTVLTATNSSVLPVANGGTGLTAGTSGGVLAFTATGTLASSTALAASALVIGGGAGAAPSTTTTGTGVVTALGVNTGTAGAFVVNGGALGSPSSVGTMPAFTLGGTIAGGGNQINNVVIGASTPLAGNFTTVNTTGIITITIPGTGIPTNLAVNTTAGAANGMSIEARADETGGTRLVQTSTTYNTSPVGATDPPNIASAGTLVSARGGGLNIVGANGPVRTYSGGASTATTSVSSTGLAVTGTLSATGAASLVTTTVIGGAGTAAGLTALTVGDATNATFRMAFTNGALIQLATNTSVTLAFGGKESSSGAFTQWAALSSTGLAVTGTLSATGTLSGGTSGTGYSFSGSAPANSLTLDSSGNLGVGVAPSAWASANPIKAIQVGRSGSISYDNGTASTNIVAGAYLSATGQWTKIGTTGAAKLALSDYDGSFFWSRAASGSGNFTYTDVMTLDASGNLGIGTTSPGTKLDVRGSVTSQADTAYYRIRRASAADVGYVTDSGTWGDSGTDFAIGASSSNLRFYTNNSATERMRLDSGGIVTMNVYGAGAATFSAAGVISSVSDETWKVKDGVPTDPDAMLKKLEPGYWYYNDEKKETFGADRQLGFYAQNVNAAIGPEAAPTPEEGKPWGYYDRSVLAITVMSLQKALATIELLTARVAQLESNP